MDISSTAIADYVGIAELELIFGPIVMEHNITITIVDNDALEGMESFFAQLSIPPGETGVTLENDQATIHIQDNDGKVIENFRTLDGYYNTQLHGCIS